MTFRFSLALALAAGLALPSWAQAPLPPLPPAPAPAAPIGPLDPDDIPLPPIDVPALEPRPWAWRPILADEMPPSIQLFEGDSVNADGQPVRAWYASVDYNDTSLAARALLPGAPAERQATSVMAATVGALVAVNGGYFGWSPRGAASSSLSLVLSGGRVLSGGVVAATRPNGKHFLTRGAFGVRADRSMDVTWAAQVPRADGAGKYLWSYPTPAPNLYAAPTLPFSREFPLGGQQWIVSEAIGGAPVLLEGGEPKITAEAEAIGPEMVVNRHPRTLIGWAGGNKMLILVCDGRQPAWSVGLTLEESALLMRDLGCVEALNLDGGGSSTFVAAGKLLNKPSDGNERRVSSIWAITKAAPLP